MLEMQLGSVSAFRSVFARIATRFLTTSSVSRSGERIASTDSTDDGKARCTIIDGKALAKQITDEVKFEVDSLVRQGKRRPHLAAILVGDDPASRTYIRKKVQACDYIGISSETIRLPSLVTQESLLKRIQVLNSDDSVDAVLVQLPIPDHISEKVICNAVTPSKDVDGFHIVNIGMFCSDRKAIIPATPAAVMEIIRRYNIPIFGKNAVVCGRSKNVGMPIAMLFHADGTGETGAGDATTTICHRYTPPEQLRALLSTADIVVSATGIPGLITGDMLKPGVAIIDVGITRVVNPSTGKVRLKGDVDFESAREKASFITPVPGGVGPMTVAMLMKNTLLSSKRELDYEFLVSSVSSI